MEAKVTPVEQTVGRLCVDIALGRIARMYAAEDWQQSQNAGGGAVFAGRAGEVLENVDSEPAPEVATPGLFNLDAHVHDLDSGHPVPYLDAHVDVTKAGAEILKDVPLVPVARAHKGTAGLHYGNNVALDAIGTYDVVLRLAPSPLTGTEQVEALNFTVTFDPEDAAGQ